MSSSVMKQLLAKHRDHAIAEVFGHPHRVQRQRTKGWRMPENTVYVGRPTRWGNPASIERASGKWNPRPWFAWASDVGPHLGTFLTAAEARAAAVDYFREWVTGPDGVIPKDLTGHVSYANVHDFERIHAGQGITELTGKNLACWCPLDQPCHADVLLELANQPPRKEDT